jgi:hypothetical protein
MSNGDQLAQDLVLLELQAIRTLVKDWIKGTRGYNGLRLERAMRSGYDTTAPTNRSTHTLWNNSSGTHYLVVRNWAVGSGSGVTGSAYVTSPLGSSLGGVAHFMPDHAPGPGLHYYADTTTHYTFDFILANQPNTAMWWVDIPFAVLPPGYGLAVQQDANANNNRVGFLWEYVEAQELIGSAE